MIVLRAALAAIFISWLAAIPGGFASPGAVAAPSQGFLMAGVLSIPSYGEAGPMSSGKGRGMAKLGTNRTLIHFGKGRGMPRAGTGRGLPRMGTDRGLPKLGTDRGLSNLGTDRGLPKVGTGRDELGLPGESATAVQNLSFEDSEARGQNPASYSGDGAGHSGRDGQADSRASPSGKEDAPFAPAVLPFIQEGDRKMTSGDYQGAAWDYSVAQNAEGFAGLSNLRLACALIASGKTFEGTNLVRSYTSRGGEIRSLGLCFPEDPKLESRLKELAEWAPQDTEHSMALAIYALGRGATGDAGRYVANLRDLHPGHPCLKALEQAVQGGEPCREDADGAARP